MAEILNFTRCGLVFKASKGKSLMPPQNCGRKHQSSQCAGTTMFIPLFDLTQRRFHFGIRAVMGDGIYDVATILNSIINTLKAKLRISVNPSNTKPADANTNTLR